MWNFGQIIHEFEFAAKKMTTEFVFRFLAANSNLCIFCQAFKQMTLIPREFDHFGCKQAMLLEENWSFPTAFFGFGGFCCLLVEMLLNEN